jgi:transposase-like protein
LVTDRIGRRHIVGLLDDLTSPPKERYAVSNDNVVGLIQPGTFEDQLTDVLRRGAKALLAQAVEAEVAEFLAQHAHLATDDRRRRVVRHGHLPAREVMTGIGPVAVRQPRVRDRAAAADDPARIRFTPAILPPYMRRSKSIETLLPVLYLKGISTGDFSEALAALLGKDAAGLSASAIGRLKDGWQDEHAAWARRDLCAKHYVYIWADGIHLEARLADEKQCILVLIGATPQGKKELVGFTDGARESAADWRDLLLDLKRRGLAVAPELVVADGALGFWKAAGEVWPRTREQRCWVHKTANVLNKLPVSQQPKAKRALQEIWMAETKAQAETAFDAFMESYQVKYEKAAQCLARDRDQLLAFYDFPAEHWKHLRTTNPIESTFATVRHRTIRSKGCLSNKTALAMVFKLAEAAQRTWRRLDGHALLPKLILGVKFADGLEVVPKNTDAQPNVAAA